MPESTYKSYFLGSLTEESAANIELRVVEDAEFAAEISAVEENLIEDYLDDRLSTEDADLFRTNYLVTEVRLKNVEIINLIKSYARENAYKANKANELIDHKESGFFHWFSSLSLGLRLATASVALIVVMTSIWFVLRPQRNNELLALQTRYEQINKNPDSLDLDTKLSELTLVSGNLRASGSTTELSRTDLTENVRFRIALPSQTENSTSYNVTIFRDTTEVFRQNNIRPLANSTAPELRILLPRAIFPVGNYRLNLQTAKALDISYYFVVR